MKSSKFPVILLVALLVLTYFPLHTVRSENQEITIMTGDTSEFGGGSYVEIRYGNEAIGVIYGNANRNNHLIIYTTGINAVKEVQKTDGSRIVEKRIMDVKTLIYEEISRIIEFRDINNNSRFDSFIDADGNYTLTSLDYPLYGLEFRSIPSGKPVIKEHEKNRASVEIIFTFLSPKYNIKWNDIRGRMEEVDGKKIADIVSLKVNLSMSISKDRISIPLYMDSRLKGEFSENGRIIETHANYSLEIKGWGFSYPDSKLFVEKKRGFHESVNSDEIEDMYVNISTSSPKYLHLKGKGLNLSKPAYGHSLRFHLSDNKIGEMRGNPVSVVDGVNRTYILLISGDSKENISFQGEEYTGFLVMSTESYWQGNVSCGEKIDMKYSYVEGFNPVSATPYWSLVAPFEVAFMTVLALIMVRRRSHTNRHP